MNISFQSILSSCNEGFLIVSVEGKILWANNSFGKIMGFSDVESLVGTDIVELCPNHKELNEKIIESFVRGAIDNVKMDKRLETQNGEIIWCRISTSLVRENEMPVSFFLHVEDITQKKTNCELLRNAADEIVTFIKDNGNLS